MLLCHTFQGFYIFWGNGLGTAFLGHLINDQCIMCVANIKWTVGCFSCGFGNALEPLEWAKTLMSRCFKIFRYFRRYTQNLMQKWFFFAKNEEHRTDPQLKSFIIDLCSMLTGQNWVNYDKNAIDVIFGHF